jgi:hypothetical protein
MIRGERPVTENTLEALSQIHQAREVAASLSSDVPATAPIAREQLAHRNDFDPVAHLVDLVISMPETKWEVVAKTLHHLSVHPDDRTWATAQLRSALSAPSWDGKSERRTGQPDRRNQNGPEETGRKLAR